MPHHLLLADDSETIQRVIKLTFADEDVDVVAVGDGNQAVAAIDKAPPDIVLVDAAMPGRTGYDVAQHIRSTPRLAHIPVVLLIGAFEPVDEARAAAAGCDGVLSKPFEPEVVISRVRELLSRPRAAAVPSPPAAAAPKPPAPLPAAQPRQRPAEIDAYFERLDRAFAGLASARPLAPPPSPPPALEPPRAAAPAPPPRGRSLVDDFEGFLSESGVPPAPIARSASPAFEPAASPAPLSAAAVSEAQMEEIVNAVIDRIAPRVAGPHLEEIVTQVAERLVREEIAKIKSRL